MGNSVHAEDVAILGGDVILLTGVAIIGDDLTLPSENTDVSSTSSPDVMGRS